MRSGQFPVPSRRATVPTMRLLVTYRLTIETQCRNSQTARESRGEQSLPFVYQSFTTRQRVVNHSRTARLLSARLGDVLRASHQARAHRFSALRDVR
jgi:hypothetical protein